MANQSQIAIVTGASRGMGLAISAQLARDGFTVYGMDILEEHLTTAFAKLQADGLAVKPAAVNITDEASVTAFARSLGPSFDDVTVVVNNAGISPKINGRKPDLAETTLGDWERVISVNLTGAFIVAKTFLPAMLKRGFGRIINNSSIGGRTAAGTAMVAYNASKAGLLGLTRALALEVAKQGVTVNAICPGRIDTPMAATSTSERNALLLQRMPVGRFGSTQEIADLVSFLASPRASFITGASIDINGGSFIG